MIAIVLFKAALALLVSAVYVARFWEKVLLARFATGLMPRRSSSIPSFAAWWIMAGEGPVMGPSKPSPLPGSWRRLSCPPAQNENRVLGLISP